MQRQSSFNKPRVTFSTGRSQSALPFGQVPPSIQNQSVLPIEQDNQSPFGKPTEQDNQLPFSGRSEPEPTLQKQFSFGQPTLQHQFSFSRPMAASKPQVIPYKRKLVAKPTAFGFGSKARFHTVNSMKSQRHNHEKMYDIFNNLEFIRKFNRALASSNNRRYESIEGEYGIKIDMYIIFKENYSHMSRTEYGDYIYNTLASEKEEYEAEVNELKRISEHNLTVDRDNVHIEKINNLLNEVPGIEITYGGKVWKSAEQEDPWA